MESFNTVVDAIHYCRCDTSCTPIPKLVQSDPSKLLTLIQLDLITLIFISPNSTTPYNREQNLIQCYPTFPSLTTPAEDRYEVGKWLSQATLLGTSSDLTGGPAIAAALCSNVSIRRLNLSWNSLRQQSAAHLGEI